MAEPASADPRPTSTPSAASSLAVLAILALSFMLYQIALLRELRFQLMTLFTLAPFLFSSVIACIAAGSVCARRAGAGSDRILRRSIVALPVIALPVFALAMAIAQYCIRLGGDSRFVYGGAEGAGAGDAYLTTSVFGFLAVAVFGYGVIFFLQGLIFALYFQEGRQAGRLGNVYGADLIASGCGALVGGVLTFFLTPVQTALAATALFVLNLWVSRRSLGIQTPVAGLATAAVLALGVGELGWGAISRWESSESGLQPTTSVWSRYRRIDAVESNDILNIYTDQLLFQAYLKHDRLHRQDPRRLAVDLIRDSERPVEDVLIIGSGSGADVRLLRDVVGGAVKITAVEIDDGFIRIARRFPWLWDKYNSAEIVVQEGRYFLENDRRKYGLVLYSFIDPQSAVGSVGVPDANFLYTAAGVKAAYERVQDGGTMLIQRVYLVGEEKEFVRRMCATLQAAGIAPENVQLFRRSWTVAWGYYGELSALHVVVKKGGKAPVLEQGDLTRLDWVPGGRPTTDLFPFSLGTGVWFDTLIGYVKRHTLILVLGGAGLLALIASMATSLSRSTFFVLGFGSFLLESMVLFNSFLLIGDPNLSAALAVGMFLLWGGIGSLASVRWEQKRWLGFAVAGTVAFYVLTAPLLNAGTIAAPVGVRCLIFALHLAPVGVVAGMMFPIALRRFKDGSVPILFFMDVVGCALAPPIFWIALSLTGVWLVMAGAVLCYAAVCAALAWKSG
jgi:spermidine synthase